MTSPFPSAPLWGYIFSSSVCWHTSTNHSPFHPSLHSSTTLPLHCAWPVCSGAVLLAAVFSRPGHHLLDSFVCSLTFANFLFTLWWTNFKAQKVARVRASLFAPSSIHFNNEMLKFSMIPGLNSTYISDSLDPFKIKHYQRRVSLIFSFNHLFPFFVLSTVQKQKLQNNTEGKEAEIESKKVPSSSSCVKLGPRQFEYSTVQHWPIFYI